MLGTRCEVVDYDTKGETHTPGFLKDVNPDGKVPVLELEDGTMLPESGAILYYLAEGTPYLPEEKLERAQVLRWMFFEQYSLLLNLSRPRLWRCGAWRWRPKKGRSGATLGAGLQGHRGDGAASGRPRILRWGASHDRRRRPLCVPRLCPEGGYHLGAFPAVQAWLERIASLPGYVPPPS